MRPLTLPEHFLLTVATATFFILCYLCIAWLDHTRDEWLPRVVCEGGWDCERGLPSHENPDMLNGHHHGGPGPLVSPGTQPRVTISGMNPRRGGVPRPYDEGHTP